MGQRRWQKNTHTNWACTFARSDEQEGLGHFQRCFPRCGQRAARGDPSGIPAAPEAPAGTGVRHRPPGVSVNWFLGGGRGLGRGLGPGRIRSCQPGWAEKAVGNVHGQAAGWRGHRTGAVGSRRGAGHGGRSTYISPEVGTVFHPVRRATHPVPPEAPVGAAVGVPTASRAPDSPHPGASRAARPPAMVRAPGHGPAPSFRGPRGHP